MSSQNAMRKNESGVLRAITQSPRQELGGFLRARQRLPTRDAMTLSGDEVEPCAWHPFAKEARSTVGLAERHLAIALQSIALFEARGKPGSRETGRSSTEQAV